MDASEILPIEIWTKILKDLKISQLISVQHTCQLFWNIIQDFVSLGQIKSDFYDIRRPYLEIELTEDNLEFSFVNINQDQINISTSKPLWILGAGFHGPYTLDNQ